MNSPSPHILVVEDSDNFRQLIVEILTQEGFQVDETATAEDALQRISQTPYDVLITDLALPGRSGVEVLEEAVDRFPEIIAIVITGFGTVETAVEAMKKGAYDYLVKPFKLIQLPAMIKKGLEENRLRYENQYLRKQLNEKYSFHNIIGTGVA